MLPKDSSYQHIFLRFMPPLPLTLEQKHVLNNQTGNSENNHDTNGFLTQPKVHKIKGSQSQKFEGWPLDALFGDLDRASCDFSSTMASSRRYQKKYWHDKKSQRKMTTRGEVCRIQLYIYLLRCFSTKGWPARLSHVYVAGFLFTFIFYWNSKSCIQIIKMFQTRQYPNKWEDHEITIPWDAFGGGSQSKPSPLLLLRGLP